MNGNSRRIQGTGPWNYFCKPIYASIYNHSETLIKINSDAKLQINKQNNVIKLLRFLSFTEQKLIFYYQVKQVYVMYY